MANNNQEGELSRELGRLLERIYVSTPERTFDDLASAYKLVEQSFLPKVSESDRLTLETKRRVAELTLYSALEKGCSRPVCGSLFRGMVEFGFTNLERKANVYLIYARHCLQTEDFDEGVSLLENLKGELKDALGRTGAEIYRKLLETLQDILRQLEVRR